MADTDPLVQNAPAIAVLALYAAAGVGLLLTVGAVRLIRRAVRARSRRQAACVRDVPHDRVTLSRGERDGWTEFRAWFDREAAAEERARTGEDTP